MTEITLRPAEISDAPAITALHVAVWRQTYRHLAPAEAFAILDEDYRLQRWSEMLRAPKKDQCVLLAESGGRLAGIGAAGTPSENVFGGRGEIKFLYIDTAFKRQGIGRRLLHDLAAHLETRRYRGAALSVVEGNEAALAFYRALGAREIGRYRDPGPIWPSQNILLGWDDIAHLSR